jgi:uncharacterized protein
VRRAVLDSNVFVSAVVAPTGTCAELVAEMLRGDLEAIISPLLVAELEVVLRRRKFRRYIDLESVEAFLDSLRSQGSLAPDPMEPAPLRSIDPTDDYLLALAFSQKARIVSGDSHLLDLADRAPICTPGDLLAAAAA